jgi:hypothetical protein
LRIAFDAAAAGLVVIMVIARLRHPTLAVSGTGHAGDHEKSPWREFRERLLDLSGVRVVVVSGALLVVVAGALIGVGQSLPQTPLGAQTGQGFQAVTASSAVVFFGVVCTVMAWTLVISGLFLTRSHLRLAGLAVLAAAAAAERHTMGDLSLFTGVPGHVAIGGILVLGLITIAADWRIDHGRRSLDFRSGYLAASTAAVIGLLVVLAYAGQAARLGGIGSAAARTQWVLELLNVTVVLILPMLLIAGADAADIGGGLADGIGWSLKHWRLAGWLEGSLAVAILAVTSLYLGPRGLVPALLAVPVLGIVVMIAARSRPFPKWTKPLPAMALASVLFWFLAAGQVAFGLVRTPNPALPLPLNATWMHERQPVFSLRYPGTCGRPRDVPRPAGIASAYIANCQPVPGYTVRQAPTFTYLIFSFPGGLPGPCATARAVMARNGIFARFIPAAAEGKWRTCSFIHARNLDTAWTWSTRGQSWLLISQIADNTTVDQLLMPTMRQMRDSLRQSDTPGPPPTTPYLIGMGPTTKSAAVRAATAWIAIAAAAGLILLLRRHRSRNQVDLALLFLICSGAWIGLTRLGATIARAHVTGSGLFNREAGGLAAIAAAGTLGYLTAAALRGRRDSQREDHRTTLSRRLRVLLVLDVTLVLVWASGSLYGAASQASSGQPAVLGLVLIAALLWELGWSGPMLNRGDPTSAIPHRARVLAYVGYLLMTTAAVLQLGTLHLAYNRAPVGIFESEDFVQAGIVEFGVPFAITVFLVTWMRAPADDSADPGDRPARKLARPHDGKLPPHVRLRRSVALPVDGIIIGKSRG